jgi:hypothetical protein
LCAIGDRGEATKCEWFRWRIDQDVLAWIVRLGADPQVRFRWHHTAVEAIAHDLTPLGR